MKDPTETETDPGRSPAASCSVPIDLLSDVYDDLCDLLSERAWSKDEPRCGYDRAYRAIQARRDAIGRILGLPNAKGQR